MDHSGPPLATLQQVREDSAKKTDKTARSITPSKTTGIPIAQQQVGQAQELPAQPSRPAAPPAAVRARWRPQVRRLRAGERGGPGLGVLAPRRPSWPRRRPAAGHGFLSTSSSSYSSSSTAAELPPPAGPCGADVRAGGRVGLRGAAQSGAAVAAGRGAAAALAGNAAAVPQAGLPLPGGGGRRRRRGLPRRSVPGSPGAGAGCSRRRGSGWGCARVCMRLSGSKGGRRAERELRLWDSAEPGEAGRGRGAAAGAGHGLSRGTWGREMCGGTGSSRQHAAGGGSGDTAARPCGAGA